VFSVIYLLDKHENSLREPELFHARQLRLAAVVEEKLTNFANKGSSEAAFNPKRMNDTKIYNGYRELSDLFLFPVAFLDSKIEKNKLRK